MTPAHSAATGMDRAAAAPERGRSAASLPAAASGGEAGRSDPLHPTGNEGNGGDGNGSHEPVHHKAGFWALTLGSVGVVYGDIGTSPLYALREALNAVAEGKAEADAYDTAGAPSEAVNPFALITDAEIIGVVSLLIWALVVVVLLKYVIFLLRADNRGEGGILSLLALVQSTIGRRGYLTIAAIIGASLFYGDAAITPAISVLSAVEGLKLVTPVFQDYVVPITIVILITLFAVQFRGTGMVAGLFGPITAVWFLVMAGAGLLHIADDPSVLHALNPYHAIRFLFNHGLIGFVVLGAVFLAVTGAEALYADLGHFGRRPIQVAWLGLVFPALVLNYLGQGALVLADRAKLENPFFLLVPEWALLPLVILATLATVIASQAVITGAFSLTRQAIQLGLLPRLFIRHTSERHTGQIYLPTVNWMLFAGVITLVVLFQNSSALASAYGIAVTGDMLVTTSLAFAFLRFRWRWPFALALLLILPFLTVELAFLSANLFKILEGGYVPILLAAVLIMAMSTWHRGTAILFQKTRKTVVTLPDFIELIENRPPALVDGTAAFLTSDPSYAPTALLHNLKHNRVLHDRNLIITVRTDDAPRVPLAERVSVEQLGERFWRVGLLFGYMETPNVSEALKLCRRHDLRVEKDQTSYFLGRRKLRPDARSGMPLWQDKLFITLARAATDPTDFYHLPPDRVVELGSQMTV